MNLNTLGVLGCSIMLFGSALGCLQLVMAARGHIPGWLCQFPVFVDFGW